jgi:glycosyltransferase involved in cell wall biosynthesis
MSSPPRSNAVADVAVVAIGRNEGERLRACLNSVIDAAALVVYVDSGSTDDSVPMARALGAQVVQLDMSVPFTAARARNAGWRRVRDLAPDLDLVQFVDGDCAVVGGWLELSRDFLGEHPDVVAVCGRRRERHPESSIYNLLCDLEWDAPPGEAKACGGDVMLRIAALEAAGGYRDSLIAGEEPELCVRLRAAGWRIWRLKAEMTAHDAAMTRASQWWKRSMRTGYTYAEGAHLHGAPPERHCVRESRRAWLWGLGLPVAVAIGALLSSPWWLAGLAIYPVQMLRLYARFPGTAKGRALRAVFLVLGKFAEVAGQFKYLALHWSGRQAHLIEYK